MLKRMTVLSKTKSALLSILSEDDQYKKQKDRDLFQRFAWEFPKDMLIPFEHYFAIRADLRLKRCKM